METVLKKLVILLFLLFIIPNTEAKTLTIVLPAAEDSHAINARLFSKYLKKHLNSNIEFKILPGAASVVAANYLYNNAPRDGSVIGVFFKNIPLIGAIGGPNINFDASKFTWLGSTADGRLDAVLLFSHKEYDDSLIVGSDNVVVADPIKFIKNMLNWNIKQIPGYRSPNEVRIAFEKKEIDAFVNSLLGIKSTRPNWLEDKNIKVLLQFGNGKIRHPNYPKVPTLAEMITEEQQKLLNIFETQYILLRPYVAPPNIPKEKAFELREAFSKAVLDPEYKEEAIKLGIDVNPIDWKESETIVHLIYSEISLPSGSYKFQFLP